MIPLTIDNIKTFLEKKQFETKVQQGQISTNLKVENINFPLFFKVYNDSNLLQIIAFLPVQVKEKTLNDTARLLHLLNKEVDIPGFGMDEIQKVLFYRIMIPNEKKEISDEMLNKFLNVLKIVCKTFFPAVAAVSAGVKSFEDILKEIKKKHG